MVSTRRSGSLSGNNSKRSSSSEDKPPSPKLQKVFVFVSILLIPLFWSNNLCCFGEITGFDF